jgi:hypothetical protein
MTKKHVFIRDIDCGSERLFLIAGPCVIEDESLMMRTAERLKGIAARLDLPLIFKSSFSSAQVGRVGHVVRRRLDKGENLFVAVPAPADHRTLDHLWVIVQRGFHLWRIDVEPAMNDQLLGSANDMQPALIVDPTEIPGA